MRSHLLVLLMLPCAAVPPCRGWQGLVLVVVGIGVIVMLMPIPSCTRAAWQANLIPCKNDKEQKNENLRRGYCKSHPGFLISSLNVWQNISSCFLHQKPCILHVLSSNFKGETSETYQRHVLSQDALRLAGKSPEDLPEGWVFLMIGEGRNLQNQPKSHGEMC